MCRTPKPQMPAANAEKQPPVLLTRSEMAGYHGMAAARRRRGEVRLDLNNATRRYEGLMIPNG